MDCYKPTTTCAKLLILSRTSDINDIFKIWLERVYTRGLHYWWVFIGSSLKSATLLLYQMLVEIHLTPWNIFLLMNMSTVGYLLPWLWVYTCGRATYLIMISNTLPSDHNLQQHGNEHFIYDIRSELHALQVYTPLKRWCSKQPLLPKMSSPKTSNSKSWLICLNYAERVN